MSKIFFYDNTVLGLYSHCIMSVQYTGGYSVHWGISLSTLWGVQYTGGDIMSTPGDAQYTGVSIQIQLFSQ